MWPIPRRHRRGVSPFYNTYDSFCGLYNPWQSSWDTISPQQHHFGLSSDIGMNELEPPTGIESATRAHYAAQQEFEKSKEKYEEAKKKMEECEKKVRQAQDMLQWTKRAGIYS